MPTEEKETKSPTEQQSEGHLMHAVQRRAEDFFYDYANFVGMENSPWDLKLLFGQLDQRFKPAGTEMRSSITIPWMTAKVMAFYLLVNLGVYEASYGRIPIHTEGIPPAVPQQPEEPLKSVMEKMEDFRKQFFGLENPSLG